MHLNAIFIIILQFCIFTCLYSFFLCRYSKNARYVPGGEFSSNVNATSTSGGGANSFQTKPTGSSFAGGFQPSGAQLSKVNGGGSGNAFSSGMPSSQSRFGRLAQFGMNSQTSQQAGTGGQSAAHLQHFQRQQQFSENSNVAKTGASGFGRHKY